MAGTIRLPAARPRRCARRDLALEWYAQLEAPRKRIFTFDNSAHSVAQEQFVAFRQILNDVIVPETSASAP